MNTWRKDRTTKEIRYQHLLLENKVKRGIHIYVSQTREVQGIHGKSSEGENQVPDATEMLRMLRANE